jgi:hypothetical protein
VVLSQTRLWQLVFGNYIDKKVQKEAKQTIRIFGSLNEDTGLEIIKKGMS